MLFSPFDSLPGAPPPVMFYLVTPGGLVVASSGLVGHWFIAKATLEERLGYFAAACQSCKPPTQGYGNWPNSSQQPETFRIRHQPERQTYSPG